MKKYIFAIMDKKKQIVFRTCDTKSQIFSFIKICNDNGYLGRWEEYLWEIDIKTGEIDRIEINLGAA